ADRSLGNVLLRRAMLEIQGGFRLVEDLPSDLAFQLTTRDAALWILGTNNSTPQELQTIIHLARLPWSMVLVESTSSQFAKEVSDQGSDPLQSRRGHVMVIAQNPVDAASTLPHRALPVFLLNGRDDGTSDESSQLGSHARTLRRANMVQHLIVSRPRLL